MGAEDREKIHLARRTCGLVMRASFLWTCREDMGESELMLKGVYARDG
jgi:hypothetical protein